MELAPADSAERLALDGAAAQGRPLLRGRGTPAFRGGKGGGGSSTFSGFPMT
jgi:hypothetical protein